MAPLVLFDCFKRISMLINCVAYEKGSKLADIPVADISEYISRPKESLQNPAAVRGS